MQKSIIRGVTIGAGVVNLLAEGALFIGLIPFLAASAILVVALPVFMLFLFLWWNAGEKEGDVPFMGF
jgi:hypothetical protein